MILKRLAILASFGLWFSMTSSGVSQTVDEPFMRQQFVQEIQMSFLDCRVPSERVPRQREIYAWRLERGYFSGFERVDAERAAEIAERMWASVLADGVLIEDEDGSVRLSSCPDGPDQYRLHVEQALTEIEDMRDETSQQYFTDIMGMFGCQVPVSRQDELVEAGIRYVAAHYGINLPDPMPAEADPVLTPIIEAIYRAIDDAGETLIRSGDLRVENGMATLTQCTSTHQRPALTGDESLAIANSLSVEEHGETLTASIASIGCSFDEAQEDLLRSHFVLISLARIGVELDATSLIQGNGEAAAHAEAIGVFERYFPLILEMLTVFMMRIEEDGSQRHLRDCLPEGATEALEQYAQ